MRSPNSCYFRSLTPTHLCSDVVRVQSCDTGKPNRLAASSSSFFDLHTVSGGALSGAVCNWLRINLSTASTEVIRLPQTRIDSSTTPRLPRRIQRSTDALDAFLGKYLQAAVNEISDSSSRLGESRIIFDAIKISPILLLAITHCHIQYSEGAPKNVKRGSAY